MKKLQVLLALFACAFLPLHAASLADLTYTTTGGKVTITDCKTAATGGLIIPNTIEGNPVTSIGDFAFLNCTSLTSITIGNGVTSIGTGAFQSCTSLTSITIPDSVTSIGDRAFLRCTSLTSITIPDGVTSIGDDAFWFCTGLTSITIGNGVTSIGEGAFFRCTSLTTIAVGAENVNYTDVNGVLFNKEKTLLHSYPAGKTDANYAITDSVTSIGDAAFGACSSLINITIPDSVTSIGDLTFIDCTSLTSITIPDSVTSIGIDAFVNCTSLTSITIPDSVTSIGDFAFLNCTSLTSIAIPNSVASIGNGAFFNCTSLTSITFQGAAPTVGSNTFLDMPNGAVALVTIEALSSFGGLGDDWNGLTVSMSVSDMVTALNAQNAALATARTAGQADVTNDPTSYNLVTQTSYNTVIAERDARFTEEQINDIEVLLDKLDDDEDVQAVFTDVN